MSEILFQYQRVNPTTWAYLASLLMIALYFKFNRVWSMRNWDIVGLILFAPPLLMVQYAQQHPGADRAAVIEQAGHIWLLVVNALFLLRLLLDTFMVRRPLLEPNLTTGGLTFLGLSLYLFLMANVVTGVPELADVVESQRAAALTHGDIARQELNSLQTHGPGFPIIFLLPQISTQSLLGQGGEQETLIPSTRQNPAESFPLKHVVTARLVAVLSQLAIVLGMALIGLSHYDNMKTGVAVATLYLLLPYTAMWTGNVTHALPGALLVWAILLYRRPLLAGGMIGLASGTLYYPLFMLPLWISFYWQRGVRRFLAGVLAMLGLLVLLLAITSGDQATFVASFQQMFGLRTPLADPSAGAWQYWAPFYRYPLLAAHVGLSLSMALWPAQKNLGTLVSYSAAVMLGTQFWHAHSGGIALAWYLPLLLLTIFRPNLEDRVAPAMVK